MPQSRDSPNERPLGIENMASGMPQQRLPIRLSDWARRMGPQLDVVAMSTPETDLQEGTVIAVFAAADDARNLLQTWERIESADQRVGFVALGTSPDEASTDGPDPEGVVKDAATRALTGGLLGAGVGALVATVIGLIAGWGAGAIAGVLGASALGAVAGAVCAYVLRSGWGEGYKESYVNPDATELAVCAITCSESNARQSAVAAAHQASPREVLVVEASGRTRKA